VQERLISDAPLAGAFPGMAGHRPLTLQYGLANVCNLHALI
jgi:hypothetical protein